MAFFNTFAVSLEDLITRAMVFCVVSSCILRPPYFFKVLSSFCIMAEPQAYELNILSFSFPLLDILSKGCTMKKTGSLIQNKISCLLKSIIKLLRYTVCKLLASSSTTSNVKAKYFAISSFANFPSSSIRIAVSFLSSVIISSIALHIACMPSLSFL